MERGYFPSVVYVGNYAVYFENKNGNSNVKFHQDETLIKGFELPKTNSVKVDRVPNGLMSHKTNLHLSFQQSSTS